MQAPEQCPSAPGQGMGSRVLVLQHRATVRYVGHLEGQEGVWVGVEYDEPDRGKHDGTVAAPGEGTRMRYFQAQFPTAGSFVKMEKINWGNGVVEALYARYNNQCSELGEVSADDMWVRTARNRKVQIEVVGVELIQSLQSQTQKLTAARLVGAGISHVGDSQQLTIAGSSLTELDLTSNLVSGWETFVPPLLTALPGLQVLNLSDNQLMLPPTGAPAMHILPGLRALVLNDCAVTWQQVLALEPALPALRELHLCGNPISSLAASVSRSDSTEAAPNTAASGSGSEMSAHAAGPQGSLAFQNLQVLSLEDSQLSDWGHITQHLGSLPKLRVLHLSNSPITTLTLPPPPSTPASTAPTNSQAQGQQGEGQPQLVQDLHKGQFAALEALYLSGCLLGQWADIDVLNKLPRLRETRLTGNPVITATKGGGRYEVLGRVAGLAVLNGAAVTSRERRDAELRYLQNILSILEDAAGGEARAAARAAHPRVGELAARFGDVLRSAPAAPGGTSIAASLLAVRLTCVAAAPGAKMGDKSTSLPRSTQLQAVRLLCEKLFKVPVSQQSLFIRTPGDPVPLDITHEEDVQTLGGLGFQNGFELLVDQLSE